MVDLYQLIQVNTAFLTQYEGIASIDKLQLFILSAAIGYLQLVRPNWQPKPNNHVNLKNSGSPKGSNTYDRARTYQHFNHKWGDGVSIVPSFTNRWKGRQFNFSLQHEAGRCTYSSRARTEDNPIISREIETNYKQLFNPEIYQSAYDRLKSRPGNMTAGVDNETLDSISKE